MTAPEVGVVAPNRTITRSWSLRDRPRVVFSAFPPGSNEQRLWLGTTARIVEGIDQDFDLPAATGPADSEGSPLVIWRIATTGSVELAVSAVAYSDLYTAQEDVRAVLAAAGELETEFVTGPRGHHAWTMRLDGETTLAARRWYPAQDDCEQSAAAVADALRELPVDDGIDEAFSHFRVKRLDAMRSDGGHSARPLAGSTAAEAERVP